MNLTIPELNVQIETIKQVLRELKRRKNPDRQTIYIYTDSLINFMGVKVQLEIDEIVKE